ncbi:hypothetical protein Rcae01_05755 [Novipirellula caenicola]|uniref:Uncharacterized protein n=1 Tax=Novipirellula caenicola TaxID=1536901 RepID=A0ABP9VYP4_9BACT
MRVARPSALEVMDETTSPSDSVARRGYVASFTTKKTRHPRDLSQNSIADVISESFLNRFMPAFCVIASRSRRDFATCDLVVDSLGCQTGQRWLGRRGRRTTGD